METLYIIFCLLCLAGAGAIFVKHMKTVSEEEDRIRQLTDEVTAERIQKKQCEERIVTLCKENQLQSEIINDFAAKYEKTHQPKKRK